ncbi:putative bis(5'-adenosyl)-triphosphatase [Lupinus albus]|uniref:Putative bis(5'-adenosyl)-triphosphatase n=1 Tax=Lupinus albus TaxID=3870 RepID=A0A6A4NZ81_LUPAL|nr:putative bis(5'-adenosyl)-triphosphatase [Lupinus albus]
MILDLTKSINLQCSIQLIFLLPLLTCALLYQYLHVLICPKREAKRVADLSADEITEMWIIAQKLGRQLESYHKASSLTFVIQDGPQAGQSVPHVHIHILPRKSGDFENNDDIYDEINEKEEELKQRLKVDIERKERGIEEMAQEADEYRKFLF